MAIVNTHYGFCAKGGAAINFTYTGEYNVREDGVVELLTSGTIVFLEPKVIDVFMVGGGGAGGYQSGSGPRGSGGGGGGYTRTVRRINTVANQSYQIQVGAGGTVNTSGMGNDGASSAFNNFTVSGGNHGENDTSFAGGAGGSGGGGGVRSNSDYGTGGSNGNDGENGYPDTNAGGNGQGYTTREFGETTGKLYGGGGGGGRYMVSSTPIVSMGGAGGGGAGGWRSDTGGTYQAAAAGVANTGGGGGGGVRLTATHYVIAASGGSGIVCFRDAQELPELAGTWVLNERLYNPQSDLSLPLIFTAGPVTGTGTEATYNGIVVPASNKGTMQYLTATYNNIYQFTNNVWSMQRQKIIIKADATASDEFRAWLASNATKQA